MGPALSRMNIRKEITGTMRKFTQWNVDHRNIYGTTSHCRRIRMESGSVGVELKHKQRDGIMGECMKGIK